MALGGAAALALTLLGAGVLGILLPGVLYMFGVGFMFANSMARTMSRFPGSMGAASAVFGVNQFLIGALVAAALELAVRAVAAAARGYDRDGGLFLRRAVVGLAAQVLGLAPACSGWTYQARVQ